MAYRVWTLIQHSSTATKQQIWNTWSSAGQRGNACGRGADREQNEEGGGSDGFHDKSEEGRVDNSGNELVWIYGPGRATL